MMNLFLQFLLLFLLQSSFFFFFVLLRLSLCQQKMSHYMNIFCTWVSSFCMRIAQLKWRKQKVLKEDRERRRIQGEIIYLGNLGSVLTVCHWRRGFRSWLCSSLSTTLSGQVQQLFGSQTEHCVWCGDEMLHVELQYQMVRESETEWGFDNQHQFILQTSTSVWTRYFLFTDRHGVVFSLWPVLAPEGKIRLCLCWSSSFFFCHTFSHSTYSDEYVTAITGHSSSTSL